MKMLLYAVLVSCTLKAQSCRIAGQVFFSDFVDHTITIKTDSGDLVNFNYDSATKFMRGSAGVLPEQLNNGDRLCVGTSEPAVVMVTARSEIEAQQKSALAAWQADSLYGVVSEVDSKKRTMALTVSVGGKTANYSVTVGPNAACRHFPKDATRLKDVVAGSLDRIAPGDAVYVRGKKNLDGTFAATLLVSGGFRSFAATIESIDVFDEAMHVRMVLSGIARTAHIGLGELHAIDGSGSGRRFYSINAADLHAGDSVLILGSTDGDAIRAWAVIAGFSPFGAIPSDPGEQMRWIFDNVSPGDPQR